MPLSDALIAELEAEAATTRRVLERVPDDKLSWTPHAKSMTLGQLALHIAGLPRAISELVAETTGTIPPVPFPTPSSRDEILSTLDDSVAHAKAKLSAWGNDGLREICTLMFDGKPVLQLPRGAVLRSVMLNHSYHHRGQITVYLRLLDVPLPSVYGPTADEWLDGSARTPAVEASP